MRNPPMPRYRHIVRLANRQLREWLPRQLPVDAVNPDRITFAALHQGNYATISNYLERDMRYMDSGG